MPKNKSLCRRCGKCCYMVTEQSMKKYPHLVVLPSEKTLCRIYNSRDRIGKVIGELDGQIFRCYDRKSLKKNFDNCPYNVPMEELINNGK